MRHYLQISATHKVLVVYRAFLSRGGTPSERARAQSACVEAANTIIAEVDRGSRHKDMMQALWTIPYHSIAAAVVLAMDLISLGEGDSRKAAERQQGIEKVRTALVRLAPTSRIARRGLRVLADLSREVDELAQQHGQGKKRRSSEVVAGIVKKIKL